MITKNIQQKCIMKLLQAYYLHLMKKSDYYVRGIDMKAAGSKLLSRDLHLYL